jgi:nucleoside-diphosphate-sugar epimerase
MVQDTLTQWAWCRLFYPYGPGEASDRLCSSAVQSLLSGKPFVLKCPSAQKDYIYIRDVAEGLACILQHGGTGIIDVGTGISITLKQVVEEIAGQMGCLDRLQLGDNEDRLGTLQANPRPLQSLGWQPTVSLQSGLKELIAAYR